MGSFAFLGQKKTGLLNWSIYFSSGLDSHITHLTQYKATTITNNYVQVISTQNKMKSWYSAPD